MELCECGHPKECHAEFGCMIVMGEDITPQYQIPVFCQCNIVNKENCDLFLTIQINEEQWLKKK